MSAVAPYPKPLELFPTLRQSRLATFDRCALSAQFEERYESGWSSHPQARGTIFHRFAAKALTRMYEDHKAGGGQGKAGTIPPDVAVAILDECLRQHDIDKRCPDCPKPIVRRYQDPERGARIVCEAGHDHSSDFVNLPFKEIKELRWTVVKFAKDNAFDIESLVDVETRLKAVITYPDAQGRPVERMLTGQLDALFVVEGDTHAIVLDWKDTWGIPGPTELGFDGYFQQRFYAWLVFKNLPMIDKVTTREFYPRFSDMREATVYRSDMEDVEAEISALVERFDRAWQEEMFPPSPGHHCHFCPRPGACPIFPGVRGEGMITDAETAARIGREATVAEASLKQRKDALSSWTSEHGPQEVSSHKGKRAWFHKPSTRTSRPSKKQLEEALMAQRTANVPIDIEALFKTSATSRFGLHGLDDEKPPTAEEQKTDDSLVAALEASLAKLKEDAA